eukprot:jgi/Mesvir1/22727/Mv14132-RA.1
MSKVEALHGSQGSVPDKVEQDATPAQIKAAYRAQQKLNHPDIATRANAQDTVTSASKHGDSNRNGGSSKGEATLAADGSSVHGAGDGDAQSHAHSRRDDAAVHARAVLLNRAYRTLSSAATRAAYNSGRALFGKYSLFHEYAGQPLSATAAPGAPTSLFVDENTCIGCRTCTHHACKTFVMDERYGRARVAVQWADSDEAIAAAIAVCPVNCIHEVESSQLPLLEYVHRSQPRAHMVVNTCGSKSGQARGVEESPFLAAERFDRKQRQVMDEIDKAIQRHAAIDRMEAMRKVVYDAVGLDTSGGPLQSTGRGADKNKSGSSSPWWVDWTDKLTGRSRARADAVPQGPCCPLVARDPSEPLLLSS